jgi:hypothetical protein
MSPAPPRTPEQSLPTSEESPVFENSPPLAVELRGLSWEAQIEAILDSQLPAPSKAQLLLQQLPHVPGEAQAPLAEAAVQVLPDSAYSAVALRTLLDPRTHGAAESVLFADLLERPDPVTLPALLQLMQVKNHPFAASARDSLSLLLSEDYGADTQAWSVAVQRRLTASP